MIGKAVLVVDDDPKVLGLLKEGLEHQGFNILTTTQPHEALMRVQQEPVAAVLLDLLMPGTDGLETLAALKKIRPSLPVILLSAYGTIEKAVLAVKQGAYDFLEKSVPMEKIAVTLKNALTQAGLEQERSGLLATVRETYKMVGESGVMKRLWQLIERIGASDSGVLITGENGTGKELVARALHLHSPRAGRAFVPVNAAAIPEQLLESELFGHEKGAFTDASVAKPGVLERADGGTLFIDEIACLDLRAQPKLFRALEYGEIQRLGSTVPKKLDLRVIAATNADLDAAMQAGTFRQDLYYRIAVLTIEVPPLRNRVEDIPLLVEHFTRSFARRHQVPTPSFSAEAMRLLVSYSWPGNIRQLHNIIEKVLILSDQSQVQAEELALCLPEVPAALKLASAQSTLDNSMKQAEKQILLRTLEAHHWNYEETTKHLSISRATLFNKLKTHHISNRKKNPLIPS